MEYHYSEIDLPNDATMSGAFSQEFSPQYLIPTKEADYELRSSMLVDGGDRFGVSSVVFDKYEELIWMGNQGGHVTSYYGPTMQKYTSFQVHMTDEIRDIVTHEEALFILTKAQLRQQIRRGLPKHTYKSPNMLEMQCLYQESPTKLLMGGHQDKLLELDITKMVETVIPIKEKGCAVLRSGGGSLVACGSACGTVALRDIRTSSNAEHTFKAHSACLSDLDMQGDLLITCGFTQSNGEAVAESYVIVWDVRYLRNNGQKDDNVWTVPTSSPPLLLHFLPAFSGRAVASAGDGHVALLHINDANEKQAVFQVDTQSTVCTVMDVAATSQALVFGDQSGHLNLFSPEHNHEPHFNQFSRETEFATPVDLPSVSFDNTSFRYSSIPMPPLSSGSRWFNEMPSTFYRRVYRKPKPIDPEVLKTMKMQGPIGYAPNPKTCRRNQMPYYEDLLEDLQATRQDRSTTQPIPQRYLKMDIRYNRNGPNEVLSTINQTGMPGIESTLPNSYCNVMLQVLYYTAPLKTTLLAHTCAKEFCLSCELGFLFHMLDTSSGAPCQASNFLRAFRTVPEAAALGLILPDRGPDTRVDLVALIQSWNRFILHQMHYEILETRRKELKLQILANSPPKGRINSIKQNGPIPMPRMNGHVQYDKYQFTEIEFLGPTEFEQDDKDEQWLAGREEGICEAEPIQPNQPLLCVQNSENHELDEKKAAKEDSEISQLFAIGRHQLNRCLKCNKEEGRESVVLACALQYPSVASRENEQRGSFIELIRASLSSRRSTPAWCEQCGKFTPTSQRGRLIRLPPILAINCGGVNVREKAYWAKGSQKDMPEAKRGASSKPCRYGLHCARPGCHFKHPESPNSTQSSSSKSPTHESSCVLPLQLLIRLQSDGDVIVNDKLQYDTSSSEPNSPNHRVDTKFKKKVITTASEEEYSLTAAVVCVEDNPKNLVAFIQTEGKDSDWYMFNDLSITPVSVDEVVQFSAWWKTPCVLFYTSAQVRNAVELNS